MFVELQYFGGQVTNSDTGFEHMIDNDYETVFIVDNFDGSIFQQLQKAGCRIVSSVVILRCVMFGEVRVRVAQGDHF